MPRVSDPHHSNEVEIADDEKHVVQTIDKQLIKVRALKQKLVFKPKLTEEPAGLMALLKKLPILTGLMGNMAGTGGAIVKFADIEGVFSQSAAATKLSLSSGFNNGGLILAIVDFFRIPAIYLAAWQMGKKAPLKLSDKARWGYASLLLGLSFVALAVPVAAPPIAIATAILGLGVSVFSLWKFFQLKHKISKALKHTVADLAVAEQELLELQEQAAHYEQALQKAFTAGDLDEIEQLTSHIDGLQPRFEHLQEVLQSLYDKKFKLEQKKLLQGAGTFLNKSVGVGLSSLGLIGVTLSLFFPPVGLGILAASAALGTLYVIGRMLTPLIAGLFGRSSPLKETKVPLNEEYKLNNADEFADQLSETEQERAGLLTNEAVHESTADLMRLINVDKPDSVVSNKVEQLYFQGKAKTFVPVLQVIAEENEDKDDDGVGVVDAAPGAARH